jgi:hypothetical protein
MMNRIVIRKAIAATAAMAFCMVGASAYGQNTYFSETNKTIAKLGAQGNFFYVYFAEPMGQSCANGVLYIPWDKKGLYTQLLAAKLTAKRISRVDYFQTGGNGTTCTVELVEIAE